VFGVVAYINSLFDSEFTRPSAPLLRCNIAGIRTDDEEEQAPQAGRPPPKLLRSFDKRGIEFTWTKR
jgi:hypothetical protein